MSELRQAAQRALDALEYGYDRGVVANLAAMTTAIDALRDALAEQPQAVATAPKRIWLQISDDRAHLDKPFPGDDVTWCRDSVADAEVEYVRADLAPPPSAPCPHIRSSGTGEWATNWCALNGPPPAPEPSEAEVEAAWRAIPASHEDSRVSVITKGDVWVMLRAAAAARNNNPA